MKIARELGIHLHFLDNLNDLLGMYTYRHKERHILLNSNICLLYTSCQKNFAVPGMLRTTNGQSVSWDSHPSEDRSEPVSYTHLDRIQLFI